MKGAYLMILGVFILGWLSHSAISVVGPAATGSAVQQAAPQDFSLAELVRGEPVERVSPHDRIKEHQIDVYNDSVMIDMQGAEWAGFADTNSMDPVIDTEANAIQKEPTSPADIHVGDIISYRTSSSIIIHRVVKIGEDSEGWYAITQGDNLDSPDPGKVRFEQIERVLVAIIY